MPTFIKPTPAAITDFTLRLAVTEATPTPTVAIAFSANVADSSGNQLHGIGGDLAPFLTPAQINAFTNAALALYAKAKAELLT